MRKLNIRKRTPISTNPSASYANLINPRYAKHMCALLESPEGTAKALKVVGRRDENALHAAVRSNVPETVALILSLDEKLAATPNVYGETPLHIALKITKCDSTSQKRQLEIVKMLVTAKGCIDLNAFSKPMWIKRGHSVSKCMWRLNVLRFAIAHNQPESVLDLLEAYGAEIGFDPNGTDKPRVGEAADVLKVEGETETNPSVSRRLAFFIGLAAMDSVEGKVARQQLMLKRYPHFIKKLGAPTSSLLCEMMSGYNTQNAILERVIGNEVAVSHLSHRAMSRSPFVIDVMFIETCGKVDPAMNIGQQTRGLHVDDWYLDALMLTYGVSTHQYAGKFDYRHFSWGGEYRLELWELQAPVVFEAADLV